MFYIFLGARCVLQTQVLTVKHRGGAVNVNAARWTYIFRCMQSAAKDNLWTASGPPNCDISVRCVAVDIATP